MLSEPAVDRKTANSVNVIKVLYHKETFIRMNSKPVLHLCLRVAVCLVARSLEFAAHVSTDSFFSLGKTVFLLSVSF